MILTIADKRYEVIYRENVAGVADIIRHDAPKWSTFDTETTGLHLKKDRPFLGAVCWSVPNREVDGYVYVFPTTPQNLSYNFSYWASLVETVYAHNTVYDLNMVANVIGEEEVRSVKNVGDTMGLCRLIFEAVSTREGGHRLGLKYLMDKFIDPAASIYEKQVKKWLKDKAASDRKILIVMLKMFGWTMTRFEAAMNKGAEPIPDEVMETFHDWRNEYPEPGYQDVPMEIMLPYVAVDVIGTDLLVHKALPVVEQKEQLQVMKDEFSVIPAVFNMSRVGIKVDRDYLMDSGERLDRYMEYLKDKIFELSGGKEFTVGQHAFIKDMYTEILGERPASTDKKFMSKQAAKGDLLAKAISKMRTVEKWKSTYVDRILEGSEYDGRFYATLDQFNPVSGRFSGNLQQQPKKALFFDLIGEGDAPFENKQELFHPRKAFLADSEEGYKIFLLDFSQVELRFQAHYTLPFGGDINLCRSYMPFKCVDSVTGSEYDYKTEEGKSRWDKTERGDHYLEQKSIWIVPETGLPWTPTDVHSASTTKALGLMGIDANALTEDEFQTWRGLGKGVNFAKNYGVGVNGAAEQFGLELPVAKALCEGYNIAFPVVITYQNNVSKRMGQRGFVSGVYGRRYYLSDSRRFYKAGNYLIQGSCAHDLKLKMVKLDALLAEYKSCMITCIHDEIIYRIHESEEFLIPMLKEIMEYTPLINVPIISEIDVTSTNWASKSKYKGA